MLSWSVISALDIHKLDLLKLVPQATKSLNLPFLEDEPIKTLLLSWSTCPARSNMKQHVKTTECPDDMAEG